MAPGEFTQRDDELIRCAFLAQKDPESFKVSRVLLQYTTDNIESLVGVVKILLLICLSDHQVSYFIHVLIHIDLVTCYESC